MKPSKKLLHKLMTRALDPEFLELIQAAGQAADSPGTPVNPEALEEFEQFTQEELPRFVKRLMFYTKVSALAPLLLYYERYRSDEDTHWKTRGIVSGHPILFSEGLQGLRESIDSAFASNPGKSGIAAWAMGMSMDSDGIPRHLVLLRHRSGTEAFFLAQGASPTPLLLSAGRTQASFQALSSALDNNLHVLRDRILPNETLGDAREKLAATYEEFCSEAPADSPIPDLNSWMLSICWAYRQAPLQALLKESLEETLDAQAINNTMLAEYCEVASTTALEQIRDQLALFKEESERNFDRKHRGMVQALEKEKLIREGVNKRANRLQQEVTSLKKQLNRASQAGATLPEESGDKVRMALDTWFAPPPEQRAGATT
jgi:hypothetical protein